MNRRSFIKSVAGVAASSLVPATAAKHGYATILQNGFLSPSEVRFLEPRAFSVGEIARWFRVPPELVNLDAARQSRFPVTVRAEFPKR
jgi:hypothetical protein